jgi:CRP/FNR family transcriptional regulator, cyclic AMP receptor protein
MILERTNKSNPLNATSQNATQNPAQYSENTLSPMSLTDTINYRPGSIILYPGRPEGLFRVRSGLVRVHTVDDEGNGLTLRYVKPGEYFGEESLANINREYFAEAVTDSSVDQISTGKLTHDDLREVTAHIVAALQRGYQHLYRLTGKRLRSRIAGELLELATTALATARPDGTLMVFATHDELAAAVGSVRETVTKVVGELSREGVIDAGYGKITLKNPQALRQIADE